MTVVRCHVTKLVEGGVALRLVPIRVYLRCMASVVAPFALAANCGGGGGTTPVGGMAPSITSFTAAPSSITTGQTTALAWTVTGATTLTINPGVGAVTGATRSVSPAATTTYTLTATNSTGSTTSRATVTVAGAATITSFTATPNSTTPSQGATLSWTVSGASTLSINPGVGAVTGASKAVAPSTTTTYTLTATNALGAATTATATVTVNGVVGTTLTWMPASSVKLEQVIGDKDWADAAKGITTPTASQTVTRFDILGNDIGYSFEDNGHLLFLFGDTISKDATLVNYHAGDPIAYSTTSDPEAGLSVNFYTNTDGSPLFVKPPGVAMGADDVPNAGISLPDGVYIVVNTGADVNLSNPQQNARSVLARFDETTKTFATGRTISQLPVGHFVFTSLHASGDDVYMYGMGNYRASDIYLSKTPATGFWTGTGTQYYTGLVSGQPTWSTSEAAAVPVVQDNPLNGPGWPTESGTVGNASVTYSSALSLWLMTYDGGRQSNATRGTYFSYAVQPWGPWATPQLTFNAVRDNASGVYIHNPNLPAPGDGLNGPTIGNNDPVTTAGGAYAPLMIERFTTVSGNLLKIYYMMSTWNPYTVVKMRSQFTISH